MYELAMPWLYKNYSYPLLPCREPAGVYLMLRCSLSCMYLCCAKWKNETVKAENEVVFLNSVKYEVSKCTLNSLTLLKYSTWSQWFHLLKTLWMSICPYQKALVRNLFFHIIFLAKYSNMVFRPQCFIIFFCHCVKQGSVSHLDRFI